MIIIANALNVCQTHTIYIIIRYAKNQNTRDYSRYLQRIKTHNQFINDTDEIKILHQMETKKNKWIIFIEVTSHRFHKIIVKWQST